MLARYWHTLRHLRPVQLYGRLWFRLYRPWPDPRPTPRLRSASRRWVAPPLRAVSMLGPARFRFLNQTHDVLGPEVWNDPALDKLWLYNLHYFDDLNAQDVPARADWHRALIDRWIAENPPGHGNGWEPYPTSLRIVNWVKWLLGRAGQAAMPSSLAIQARWLTRRLEHHLLGNHLFANAKALVFAGAFFDGPEAERWLALGQPLLRRELNEQILADGGHFERSPMYHAILLEDVLDVLNLADVYPGVLDHPLLALCRVKSVGMLDWLAAMTHPDGEISFFNDAAFGIAPKLADLGTYAKQVGVGAGVVGWNKRSGSTNRQRPESSGSASLDPPNASTSVIPAGTTDVGCWWLPDSGYVRLEAGPAVALLDCAPIGPDYLPGHAHADTLSFELSLFGQRVIVNGGTSRYGSGPGRLAERGTAAHSTVQIDGADSSEVWGGFRVARRARPFDVVVSDAHNRIGAKVDLDTSDAAARVAESRTQGCQVSAAHDGYRRLPGRPVHRRGWSLTDDGLSVIDVLEGDYSEAVARVHLHPAVKIAMDQTDLGDALDSNPHPKFAPTPHADAYSDDGATGVLTLPDGQSVAWRLSGGRVRIVANHWHPQFGLSEPSHCLEVIITGRECRFELCWAPGAWP